MKSWSLTFATQVLFRRSGSEIFDTFTNIIPSEYFHYKTFIHEKCLENKNDKFQKNLSRPGIIDARARWLRNTGLHVGHNTDQQGFARSRFEWPKKNRSISNMLYARELQNALCKQYASLVTKSSTFIGAVRHNRDSALNTYNTTVAHRDSIQQTFTVFYLDRTQGRIKMRCLCSKTFIEYRCIATASLYRDCSIHSRCDSWPAP